MNKIYEIKKYNQEPNTDKRFLDDKFPIFNKIEEVKKYLENNPELYGKVFEYNKDEYDKYYNASEEILCHLDIPKPTYEWVTFCLIDEKLYWEKVNADESKSQKNLLKKILDTLDSFNNSVQNVIIEFGENVRVHDKHYGNKQILSSYTYEDNEGMTHIKRKYLFAKFPEKETYRNLITAILDEFWTPYNPRHSTEKLEKQLISLFTEMDIEIVVFEQADAKLSKKPTAKLLNLLNNTLKVSVVFVNSVFKK